MDRCVTLISKFRAVSKPVIGQYGLKADFQIPVKIIHYNDPQVHARVFKKKIISPGIIFRRWERKIGTIVAVEYHGEIYTALNPE